MSAFEQARDGNRMRYRRALRHATGMMIALLAGSMPIEPSLAQTREAESGVRSTQAQSRPNVVVFLLDDVGYGQIGSFGGLIDTPNIDRVAARGTRYTNYHTTPICSSRLFT